MKTQIKSHKKSLKKSRRKFIKSRTLNDFFGRLGRDVKIDAQKMKDESRKMWKMD